MKTRVKGHQRVITIGKLGVWTIEKARKQAGEIARLASAGIEPAPHKLRGSEKAVSLKNAVEIFIDAYGHRLKPRTKGEYERLLTKFVVPRLGSRPIEGVTSSDIIAIHERMGDHKRNANHVLSAISRLMTWCEARGWRPKGSNPCRGVQRYKENKRNRYLSPDEAQRLGEVLRKVETNGSENPFVVAAIWLIIFTGARRSEILTLKWDYVETSRAALMLPDSKSGPKTILLNRQAMEILGRLERVGDNPYVFVGHINGTHLVNIARPWARIREAAGLPDLRLHDLRHSFGNRAIDAGGSTRVLGVLLGHSREETTTRYAHVSDHRAWQLVQKTGELIAETMKPKAPPPRLRAQFRIRRLARKGNREWAVARHAS
jgi:integrase